MTVPSSTMYSSVSSSYLVRLLDVRLGDSLPFGLPTKKLAIAHRGTRERFLRAELLHALKRDAEALPLYQSFPAG